MKTTLDQLKEAAKNFLDTADKLNELVSDYLDGSNSIKAVNAYNKVKDLEVIFTRLYNSYYDDRIKPGLNYELAESML